MTSLVITPNTLGSGTVQLLGASCEVNTTLTVPLYSPLTSAYAGWLSPYQNGTAKTSAYTLTAADKSRLIVVGAAGSIVIPAGVFSQGDVVSIYNDTTTLRPITPSGVTATVAGTNGPFISVDLLERGFAEILFLSSTSCIVSGNLDAPLGYGLPYGGGYFAGQISTAGNGIADYNLVVSPKANELNASFTATDPAANSLVDGFTNTTILAAAGDSTSASVLGLSIGGFTDWYIPASLELEICYYNLKPGSNPNTTSSGANAYAVPPRAANYASDVPGITVNSDFRTFGGAQAFVEYINYSSSFASPFMRMIQFIDGSAGYYNPAVAYSIRPIRKVAV